jgi:hypothetical protein
MTEPTPSPLTEDDYTTSEYEVFEIVYFRATSTDEEWAEDAASSQYELTREEAAQRLDAKDYSPL